MWPQPPQIIAPEIGNPVTESVTTPEMDPAPVGITFFPVAPTINNATAQNAIIGTSFFIRPPDSDVCCFHSLLGPVRISTAGPNCYEAENIL
jgi:hypothetical protein